MKGLLENIYFRSPKLLQTQLVTMYGRKLWKKRYGEGFAERLAEIASLDALDPKSLDVEIGHRICSIVTYSGKHIPYYRELFAKHRIDPREINSIEALSAIPPLEKETLRARPDDFLIATGKSYTLEEFVKRAFSCFDMDWHDYVMHDLSLLRPSDLAISRANPEKAEKVLGWKASYYMKDVVRMMVEHVRGS